MLPKILSSFLHSVQHGFNASQDLVLISAITMSPQDKAQLNKAVEELKQLLHDENQKAIQT